MVAQNFYPSHENQQLIAILSTNKKKNDGILTNIKLPNISPEFFHVLLRYIYGGKLSLEEYDISDIIKILVIASELNLQEFHNLNSIEFSKKESLPRISMSKQKSTLDITKVTNSDKESQEVEKNLEEAFKRYKKAAEDGNEVAVYNLAGCYKYGKGVEKDELCRNLEFLRGIITSLLRYMQDIFRPRIFKRSTY
ncbi:BTB/POZ protein [Rhizophagus irregularis DAOM 181602=DAOM 197198]|nr:BTB/POZ protein [Rhizophagus irregularis DAOM 181602=DAOM 197198]